MPPQLTIFAPHLRHPAPPWNSHSRGEAMPEMPQARYHTGMTVILTELNTRKESALWPAVKLMYG